ncbi:MAG: slipin family protein [Flavihumibacter sp.]
MKQVKLNAWQVGLVFKNGAYCYMIREGTYWIWNKSVNIYEMTQPFTPPVELNILLADTALAGLLEVVEVNDKEIALQYENGLFKQVLTPGRYAYWKGPASYRFVKADLTKIEITEPIERNILTSAKLAPYVRSYTVENQEKALLFIDGQYSRELPPGVYYWWKNAISINVGKADTRQLQLEINGQEILTRDKAALRVNAWAQYKVTDIRKALLENKDYERQLYISIQLALREYLAAYALDELLDKKEAAAQTIAGRIDTGTLGVTLMAVGIRDIILPGDVKEIMNQVLVAEKKAQANVIARREETASTRSMLNTAKLMEDNAMLWKLKEMEYVEKIADKINTISVNGNGQLIEQLKQLFTGAK